MELRTLDAGEINKMKTAMCDILETALPDRGWTIAEVEDYLRDFLLDLSEDEDIEFERLL